MCVCLCVLCERAVWCIRDRQREKRLTERAREKREEREKRLTERAREKREERLGREERHARAERARARAKFRV